MGRRVGEAVINNNGKRRKWKRQEWKDRGQPGESEPQREGVR